MIERLHTFIANILRPYGAILFLNNKFIGLLLLGVTFLNPSVALGGLSAILFTVLFAELIGLSGIYLAQGFYIYNSLLVGMGIGFLYLPSWTSTLFIAIGASFTFILSFTLNRLFSYYKIPILSLPFSIVTMFVYLASLKYSSMLSNLTHYKVYFDIDMPLLLGGFFSSLGTIFFLPSHLAGLLIFLILLFVSRIVTIMAVTGYIFGVLLHSAFIGSLYQAVNDPFSFNYILVAVALCGIFLLPTVKNFFLALIGVAISVVLTDAIGILFNYYGIPVFTLPFNITVIVFIFVLSVTYYKEFNVQIKATPEESFANYLSQVFRFATTQIKISLPFFGEWSVYQAFDDEWTHKGNYRHAYDFVKMKEGKTFENDGLYLEDYFAFTQPVAVPVNGYITAVRDDLADNLLGEVDRVNNWGNYIIIKSDYGFYVQINHLMQYSLQVQVGDYVSSGTIIAKCGNSGYSPQPHIHIQVQETPLLGGFTKPFVFSEYIQKGSYELHTLPDKNSFVEAITIDKSIQSRFLFVLDDVYSYDVYKDEQKIAVVIFTVKMDESGEFYLCDEQKNKLYFYNDNQQFYFYKYKGKASYLKEFFRLAPRILFVNKELQFYDFLPPHLLFGAIKTSLLELGAIFSKSIYKQEKSYSFDGKVIYSEYGKVSLSLAQKGFETLEFEGIALRRTAV